MANETPSTATGSQQDPVVALFKTQLDNECAAIGRKFNIDDRGKQLACWYLLHIEGLSDADTEDAVCDGSGDLGIDAIWIDEQDPPLVHFYQFKNPRTAGKGFAEGDVDKVISGLNLIIAQNYKKLANSALVEKIERIYEVVVGGYRLHLVTSGNGFGEGSGPAIKLNSFQSKLRPGSDFFGWNCDHIKTIQDRHYAKTLPAVEDAIVFRNVMSPYKRESGSSQSFMLDVGGVRLAELYAEHGELLLQRNIRVSQGATPTNRSILHTCSSADSMNFLHYNNGVTFLCDSANHDDFKHTLTLNRAQVVNGGQTIRTLHEAFIQNALNNDVLVPLRVVTSNGNKEFGSNVAVNQNNQNQMRPGFLRSNHPIVVTLANTLIPQGWYLERRDGEVAALSAGERTSLETRLRGSLNDKVIRLQEGTQAYVATYYGHPEMAKKDPKKMFLSVDDGGSFDKIFTSDLSADKFITAYQIKCYVDDFVDQFASAKRRKAKSSDHSWKTEYRTILGDGIVQQYSDIVDQVLPNSALFLCATLFYEHVRLYEKDPLELPRILSESQNNLVQRHILRILEFRSQNPDKANHSWPTLLKSNRFFFMVMEAIQSADHQKPFSLTP